MTWAHREADANCIKWLLSHQYADEFADAPTQHAVSITAMTNDATVQTIAARVEAYERKRALPAPEPEAIEAESVEVQEDNAELQSETPRGRLRNDDGTPSGDVSVYVDNNGRQWQTTKSRWRSRLRRTRRAILSHYSTRTEDNCRIP
jgi:hypothetical protein